MSWKHYVGGIATAIGVAGIICYATQVDKLRGERILSSTEIDGTVRLVQEDRKWIKDKYRIDVLDKEGKIKMRFCLYGRERPTTHVEEDDFFKGKRLEESANSNDF